MYELKISIIGEKDVLAQAVKRLVVDLSNLDIYIERSLPIDTVKRLQSSAGVTSNTVTIQPFKKGG